MEIEGKTQGKAQLHSDDATFCGIDVYPSEIYEAPINEDRIFYTGVIVPQPEYFEGYAQWKETDNLEHRIEILQSIHSLVGKEGTRAVLCFTIHTTKANGWLLGKHLLNYFTEKNLETQTHFSRKGRYYKIQDKAFNETHAITLFTYACAIAAMFQHIAREVSKRDSLATLQKPVLQFLIDNVSGDPAPGKGIQWYLDLMLFIIENSELSVITRKTLKESCYKRFGISVPVSNIIEGGEEIVGHKRIPLMIAADWFTKVCSRYHELDLEKDELAEDDQLIAEIMKTLEKRKCLIRQTLPRVSPEEKWNEEGS